MKVKKLLFVAKGIYVGGDQGKCDASTHDVEVVDHGFLVRHRATGDAYFVPFALAYAALAEAVPETAEDDAEDEETGDESGARPAVVRRSRQKKDPASVQT